MFIRGVRDAKLASRLFHLSQKTSSTLAQYSPAARRLLSSQQSSNNAKESKFGALHFIKALGGAVLTVSTQNLAQEIVGGIDGNCTKFLIDSLYKAYCIIVWS